ncbi:pentapeptide repeat-containing protein [Streptomyces sp. CA-111067]|uniref:pentapeptide repeat-containing protein n=1 Tax=Streptomyces sp. CA-111067 TaxID=3240046 RepID=UPI003D993ADD
MRSRSSVRSLAWFRRHSLALGLGLGIPATLGAILLVLGPLSWSVAGDTVRSLRGTERADAINAVRQTVLGSVAGATVFASLAYTARTYLLSRRGQVTERFRAAVDQLASDKLEVRLGAIYSFEHVLNESPQDHRAVVGVLAAFIRSSTWTGEISEPGLLPEEGNAGRPVAGWGTQPPVDIQVAVEVLARRPEVSDPIRVDLRYASLAGLRLHDYEFKDVPGLRNVFLTWANLQRIALRGVDLRGSILNGADMRDARLDSVRLDGAQLNRVDLRSANLYNATLTRTDLRGADLRDCGGLTAEQLAGAGIDAETRLPAELQHDRWVAARLADCVAWDAQTDGHRSVPPATPEP